MNEIRNKINDGFRLKGTLDDLERYINIDICIRIVKKDLREPSFVNRLPLLLSDIRECLDKDFGYKELYQMDCDVIHFILSNGFYVKLTIKGWEEAALKMNNIYYCLRMNKSRYSLDTVEKCLKELHSIRLSTSSVIFDKIFDTFNQVDQYLKKFEKNICEEIYKDFSTYESEFSSDIEQNVDTNFIYEHHVYPLTRRWLIDIVVKWSLTKKKLLIISGKEKTGKSAICSVLYNFIPNLIMTAHQVKKQDNSINQLIESIFNQLRLGCVKFRNNSKDIQIVDDWYENFENFLRKPSVETYGYENIYPKHVVILDSPENALDSEIIEFTEKFLHELPSSICLILTVNIKFAKDFIECYECNNELVILHERCYLSKHVNDLETYVSGVVGALLAGEHLRDKPDHACSDERIIQNCVDELLRMSGGRY